MVKCTLAVAHFKYTILIPFLLIEIVYLLAIMVKHYFFMNLAACFPLKFTKYIPAA